ncbi:Ubiquitin-associated domain [Trypanosoma melophagium]|uniref:Ubiquitin-associated domain n=1 Tax=Trypanosoma melophagium TaxID=715481 RepID=UPI003519F467|nr:Ubiquitin-associated domain [Trypanosoma melophagium]
MLYQIVSNVCDAVELFIDDAMTVGEVRVLAGAMVGAEEDRHVAVTFQGHLLHDDGLPWAALLRARPLPPGGPRKLFVHVSDRHPDGSAEAMRVALRAAAATREEERAGRDQARMMEPIIDMMVQNPRFMDAVLGADPAMKRILKGNPEMERMLRDPETLKSFIMAQMDPEQRRLMSRDLQLQMAQVSAIPGGEQLLERYVTSILQELDSDGDPTQRDTATEVDEEQARPDPNKEANCEALPNPWKQQSSSASSSSMQNNLDWMGPNTDMTNFLLNNLGGENPSGSGNSAFPSFLQLLGNSSLMSGDNPFATAGSFVPQGVEASNRETMAQPSTTAPASEKTTDNAAKDKTQWAAQLAMLKDMGFDDEALCLEALNETNGDVDAAVSFIVDKAK